MATCAFSNGFDSGFEICDDESVDTPTLRGVPALKPRRRPDVREIAGVGYVHIIGAGSLTGEACLAGDLSLTVEASGTLVGDALRLLTAVIRDGAEALILSEYALHGSSYVYAIGEALGAVECAVSGVGAASYALHGSISRDQTMIGLVSIRAGAEAVIAGEESEEILILAAAAYLRQLLSA